MEDNEIVSNDGPREHPIVKPVLTNLGERLCYAHLHPDVDADDVNLHICGEAACPWWDSNPCPYLKPPEEPERITCEHCGGPCHMDDVLTTDGLMPHMICDDCGYKWVPEIVYQEYKNVR